MKRISLAVFVLLLTSSQAHAAPRPATHRFAVPATTLDAALARFAEQSGVDVGTPATGLRRIQSPGAIGRMSAAAALKRLLAGTPYRAVPLPGGGYRIEAAPVRAEPAAPCRPTAPEPSPEPSPTPDLIVTASKRGAGLLRFPGSVAIVGLGGAATGSRDSLAEVVARNPTVQATALGTGRNKLFVRGIADSSFLGPSAATTSVYLGDVLLAYNGPSPNLSPVDIAGIEILEGPQGTLYGAGAIGGVVKVTPRAPDLAAAAGSVSAGVTATTGGAGGHDGAAMVNLPVLRDRVGLRLVGYDFRDGGYVDDALRALRNVNRTGTRGGRAALRIAPGGGWTVDLGIVAQTIDAPDSQYALRGLPGLARRSAIAQPFRNRFLLYRAEISRAWDSGLRLVSATGLVRDEARDRFDATIDAALPLAYDTDDRNRFLTQETRLSRTVGNGDSWLVGASLFHDRDVTARAYGSPDAERAIVGVTNRTTNAALFGEATIALTRALAITAGARVTHAEIDSEPFAVPIVGPAVRGRRQTRLDPTVAVSWLVAPHAALFARFQPGFRTGGLAVAPGIGRTAAFRSDSIHVGEAGVRLERGGPLGLSASAALSIARWHDIQADLIDRQGFPFTANVGDGHIAGLEGEADWVPIARLHVTGGFFLAHSRGVDPDADTPATRATRLPDTPRFSGDLGVAHEFAWRAGMVRLSVDARYVGSSYLDPGAMLNIRQGDYAEIDLAARWQVRALELSFAIDNLANARGDRFALGNPFGVASGEQFTPLRPRSARLGASVTW